MGGGSQGGQNLASFMVKNNDRLGGDEGIARRREFTHIHQAVMIGVMSLNLSISMSQYDAVVACVRLDDPPVAS